MALSGGAKNVEIEDFMPKIEGAAEDDEWTPRQTMEEQLAMLEAMAARSNARASGSAG